MAWDVKHEGSVVVGSDPLKLRLISNDSRWEVHCQTAFAGGFSGKKVAEGTCDSFADGQTKATKAAMEIVESLIPILQGT